MKLFCGMCFFLSLLMAIAAVLYWPTETPPAPGITTTGQVAPAVAVNLQPGEYLVRKPVKEKRTKTVQYIEMVVKREAKTVVDPVSGESKTYIVAKHVPETREREVEYMVTRFVTEIHRNQ